MLTGTGASAARQSFNVRPEPATAKQDRSSEVAQTFRDRLHALGKEQREASHDVRGRKKPDAEIPAWAPPQSDAAQTPTDPSKHERTAGAVADAAHPQGQAHEQRAETPIASPGTSSAGDPASAALTAKFAERLALPAQMASETQVLLDISRYAVSSVTVTGSTNEGLSLSYDGHSANGDGGQQDEEALRQRLEARGLKVAKISGQS
jgi:hypothetical protein